jgi:hypothetical protein
MISNKPPKGHQYQYYIHRNDNNEELADGVITNRSWWKSVNEEGIFDYPKEMPNLTWRWSDLDYQIEYEPLRVGIESCTTRKAVHNFPQTVEIGNKDDFFRHLHHHCKSVGLDVLDFVPLTFSFRLNEVEFVQDLQNFCRIFKAVESGVSADDIKPLRSEIDELLGEEVQIFHEFALTGLPPRNVKGRSFKNARWGEFKLHDTFFGAATNMWILKPSQGYEGRGIEIFRSLEELERFLQIYISGCRLVKYKHIKYSDSYEVSPSLLEGAICSDIEAQVINHFVIQKYMEKPLLFEGHKFDIRPHGLLNQERKLFLFKEVYGKVASLPYSTDKKNYFAHLTNASVGIRSESYGKLSELNCLTHEQIANTLEEQQKNRSVKVFEKFDQFIFEETSKFLHILYDAVFTGGVNKLNPQEFPNVFELFGYDIMVDESMRCWFIEANGEPGIDDSGSKYFLHYMNRMIDDLCKLTIDKIFPAPEEGFRKNQVYPFRHYPDEENLWVEIADYSNK